MKILIYLSIYEYSYICSNLTMYKSIYVSIYLCSYLHI